MPADRSSASLIAIFAVALMLRLAMVPLAGIYHPDELFQYFEQAHRLVFGQGIVPWEMRYGMRSGLLPLLIVPPMALGSAIAPASFAYLLLPRALAACLSLSIVWSAWAFGARISRSHGLIAAAIAAVWGEFVYLAPHILSETASIALILPAAALLSAPASRRQLILAGTMLGFALVLRLQHAPAIVVLLLLTMPHWRGLWLPLLGGALLALLACAAIDLAMGQLPFGWAFEYVRQNVVHDRASRFGTAPAWAYAKAMVHAFGWWSPAMLVLAALGARRERPLLWIAVINLAVHMAIPHKEYRFILLSTALLLVLAAIGTGDVVAAAARRWPARRGLAGGLALLAWAGASAALAIDGRVGHFAQKNDADLAAFTALHRDPALCGVATLDEHFSAGGGYTYLHRAIPYYSYETAELTQLRREGPAFNRIIAPAGAPPLPGFTKMRCMSSSQGAALCILARPGRCTATASPAEINRKLIARDE